MPWIPIILAEHGVILALDPIVVPITHLTKASGMLLKPFDTLQVHRDIGWALVVENEDLDLSGGMYWRGFERRGAGVSVLTKQLLLTPLHGDGQFPGSQSNMFRIAVQEGFTEGEDGITGDGGFSLYWNFKTGGDSPNTKPVHAKNTYYWGSNVSKVIRNNEKTGPLFARDFAFDFAYGHAPPNWARTEFSFDFGTTSSLATYGLGIGTIPIEDPETAGFHPVGSASTGRWSWHYQVGASAADKASDLVLWNRRVKDYGNRSGEGNPTGFPTGNTDGQIDVPVWYVYWFTWYSSTYDMESRAFGMVAILVGNKRMSAQFNSVFLNVTQYHPDNWPTVDEIGGNPESGIESHVDHLRIYRHRCGTEGEAHRYMDRKTSLVGGLIDELQRDDIFKLQSMSGLSIIAENSNNQDPWVSHLLQYKDEWTSVYEDDSLYTLDTEPSYPLIVVAGNESVATYERNIPKKPFTVGVIFQECLVTNSPEEGRALVRFTPPQVHWCNPDPYFFFIATDRDDIIQDFALMNDFMVILLSNSLWVVDFLPFGPDVGAFRGRFIRQLTHGIGVVNKDAWVLVDTEQGEMIVWLSSTGLMISNGEGWSDACEQFSVAAAGIDPDNFDQIELELDQHNYRMRLFCKNISGEQVVYDFYYHPSHVMKTGFKLMGPTPWVQNEIFWGSVAGSDGGIPVMWAVGGQGLYKAKGFYNDTNPELRTGTLLPENVVGSLTLSHMAIANAKHIQIMQFRLFRNYRVEPDGVISPEMEEVVGTSLATHPNVTMAHMAKRGSWFSFGLEMVETPYPFSVGPLFVNVKDNEDGIPPL